jgi:Tfp pilus assembly protein PilF
MAFMFEKLEVYPKAVVRADEIAALTIRLDGFVNQAQQITNDMPNRSMVFLLGAGASITSGVPSGEDMVMDWLYDMFADECGLGTLPPREPEWIPDETGRAVRHWAASRKFDERQFDPQNAGAFYSAVYSARFSHDWARGEAYLENKIKGKRPGLGYVMLAGIIAKTRHTAVITTNFDNLVMNALTLMCDEYPLEISHSALASFATGGSHGPVVVKVHHDLRLDPKIRRMDLLELSEDMKQSVQSMLRERTLVVVGYAGRDQGLMDCLLGLSDKSIPGGVYWCYYLKGDPPSEKVVDFVRKQNGKFVPHDGFDLVMTKLTAALRLDSPMTVVQGRSEKLLQALGGQYQEVVDAAATRERSEDELSAEDELPDVVAREVIADRREASPAAQELAKTLVEIVAQRSLVRTAWEWIFLANAEPDRAKRTKILENASGILPNSPEVFAALGSLRWRVERDFCGAEKELRRALELGPDNSLALAAYGSFLVNATERKEEAKQVFALLTRVPKPRPIDLARGARLSRLQLKDDHGAGTLLDCLAQLPGAEPFALALAAVVALKTPPLSDRARAFLEKLAAHPDAHPHALAVAAGLAADGLRDPNLARKLITKVAAHADAGPHHLAQAAAAAAKSRKNRDLARQLLTRLVDDPDADPHALAMASGLAADGLRDPDLARRFIAKVAAHADAGPHHLAEAAAAAAKSGKNHDLARQLLTRLVDDPDADPPALAVAARIAADGLRDPNLARKLITKVTAHADAGPQHLAEAARIAAELLADAELSRLLLTKLADRDDAQPQPLVEAAAAAEKLKENHDLARMFVQKIAEHTASLPQQLVSAAGVASSVFDTSDTATMLLDQTVAKARNNAVMLARCALGYWLYSDNRALAESVFVDAMGVRKSTLFVLGCKAFYDLATDHKERGTRTLQGCISRAEGTSQPRLTASLWFLALAADIHPEAGHALGKIKALLGSNPGFAWVVSPRLVLQELVPEDCDERDWLNKLVLVMTGKATLATLDNWPRWRNATY